MNAHTTIGAEGFFEATFNFNFSDDAGTYVNLSATSPAALAQRIAEVAAKLAALAGVEVAVTTSPAPLSSADTTGGSEGRPARAKKATSEPVGPAAGGGISDGKVGNGEPEPAAEEASATADEPAAAPADVTYEDVRSRVLKLSATKGRDAALAVFEQLGVANAKELAEDQWPAAIAALDEALA